MPLDAAKCSNIVFPATAVTLHENEPAGMIYVNGSGIVFGLGWFAFKGVHVSRC